MAAVQDLIKSTIYNLAHNGGLGVGAADIYTLYQAESFFNLTNMVYSCYLMLVAQQIYFDPSGPPTVINKPPVQVIVLLLELRLFVSPIAAHTCFSILVLLAIASISMVLHWTHGNCTPRSIVSGDESQINLIPQPSVSISSRDKCWEASTDNEASTSLTLSMPVPPHNMSSIACAAAAAYSVEELQKFFGTVEAVNQCVVKADTPQVELAWGNRSFRIDLTTGKIKVGHKAADWEYQLKDSEWSGSGTWGIWQRESLVFHKFSCWIFGAILFLESWRVKQVNYLKSF